MFAKSTQTSEKRKQNSFSESQRTFSIACLYSSLMMLRQMICRLGSQNLSRCMSSTSTNVTIRHMDPSESPVLRVSLQKQEGTELRNEDLKLLHGLDKQGFFLAVSSDGEIAGTIGAVRLTDEHGFIGFCHVTDEFEDKGLEEKLWMKALDHLGNRNIGIEVTEGDVDKCKELGFKEEWRTGRFHGIGLELPKELMVQQAVKPLHTMAMGKVVDYDTTASGIFKVPLVLGWCAGGAGYAALEQGWCAGGAGYAALEQDQRVMGYGTIHPLAKSKRHRIAPLLAENVGIAQLLLISLLSCAPKKEVFIDCPLMNPTFVNILTNDFKMTQVQENVRMYTKGHPGFPVQKTFGLLSPHIGC